MSIVLPTLFVLAGVLSFAAMWHAIASNIGAITDLRRRIGQPEFGCAIMVNLRDDAAALDSVAPVRRPRQVRLPHPKPVTHRLHQFAKARTAA